MGSKPLTHKTATTLRLMLTIASKRNRSEFSDGCGSISTFFSLISRLHGVYFISVILPRDPFARLGTRLSGRPAVHSEIITIANVLTVGDVSDSLLEILQHEVRRNDKDHR